LSLLGFFIAIVSFEFNFLFVARLGVFIVFLAGCGNTQRAQPCC
jgi:hypothetical protein